MTNTAWLAVPLAIGLSAACPAVADVYRCEQDGKKIVYQQTPCETGSQTAVDGKAARRVREQEEQRRKADEKRAKEKT